MCVCGWFVGVDWMIKGRTSSEEGGRFEGVEKQKSQKPSTLVSSLTNKVVEIENKVHQVKDIESRHNNKTLHLL